MADRPQRTGQKRGRGEEEEPPHHPPQTEERNKRLRMDPNVEVSEASKGPALGAGKGIKRTKLDTKPKAGREEVAKVQFDTPPANNNILEAHNNELQQAPQQPAEGAAATENAGTKTAPSDVQPEALIENTAAGNTDIQTPAIAMKAGAGAQNTKEALPPAHNTRARSKAAAAIVIEDTDSDLSSIASDELNQQAASFAVAKPRKTAKVQPLPRAPRGQDQAKAPLTAEAQAEKRAEITAKAARTRRETARTKRLVAYEKKVTERDILDSSILSEPQQATSSTAGSAERASAVPSTQANDAVRFGPTPNGRRPLPPPPSNSEFWTAAMRQAAKNGREAAAEQALLHTIFQEGLAMYTVAHSIGGLLDGVYFIPHTSTIVFKKDESMVIKAEDVHIPIVYVQDEGWLHPGANGDGIVVDRVGMIVGTYRDIILPNDEWETVRPRSRPPPPKFAPTRSRQVALHDGLKILGGMLLAPDVKALLGQVYNHEEELKTARELPQELRLKEKEAKKSWYNINSSEEETAALDRMQEVCMSTIHRLRNMLAQINQLAPDEQLQFVLPENLGQDPNGGQGAHTVKTAIRNAYGHEQGNELIKNLFTSPIETLPKALSRLEEHWAVLKRQDDLEVIRDRMRADYDYRARTARNNVHSDEEKKKRKNFREKDLADIEKEKKAWTPAQQAEWKRREARLLLLQEKIAAEKKSAAEKKIAAAKRTEAAEKWTELVVTPEFDEEILHADMVTDEHVQEAYARRQRRLERLEWGRMLKKAATAPGNGGNTPNPPPVRELNGRAFTRRIQEKVLREQRENTARQLEIQRVMANVPTSRARETDLVRTSLDDILGGPMPKDPSAGAKVTAGSRYETAEDKDGRGPDENNMTEPTRKDVGDVDSFYDKRMKALDSGLAKAQTTRPAAPDAHSALEDMTRGALANEQAATPSIAPPESAADPDLARRRREHDEIVASIERINASFQDTIKQATKQHQTIPGAPSRPGKPIAPRPGSPSTETSTLSKAATVGQRPRPQELRDFRQTLRQMNRRNDVSRQRPSMQAGHSTFGIKGPDAGNGLGAPKPPANASKKRKPDPEPPQSPRRSKRLRKGRMDGDAEPQDALDNHDIPDIPKPDAEDAEHPKQGGSDDDGTDPDSSDSEDDGNNPPEGGAAMKAKSDNGQQLEEPSKHILYEPRAYNDQGNRLTSEDETPIIFKFQLGRNDEDRLTIRQKDRKTGKFMKKVQQYKQTVDFKSPKWIKRMNEWLRQVERRAQCKPLVHQARGEYDDDEAEWIREYVRVDVKKRGLQKVKGRPDWEAMEKNFREKFPGTTRTKGGLITWCGRDPEVKKLRGRETVADGAQAKIDGGAEAKAEGEAPKPKRGKKIPITDVERRAIEALEADEEAAEQYDAVPPRSRLIMQFPATFAVAENAKNREQEVVKDGSDEDKEEAPKKEKKATAKKAPAPKGATKRRKREDDDDDSFLPAPKRRGRAL